MPAPRPGRSRPRGAARSPRRRPTPCAPAPASGSIGRVSTPRFGVYVHIPFCAHRCDYCDFATWTDRAHVIDDYVEACVTDVVRRVGAGTLGPATSVFFGGGTPSLVPAQQLARILDVVPRAADAEVSIECNPDSTDVTQL